MSAPQFTVETFQNEYLPVGAREVNAVITVTSAARPDRPADAADGGGAAEIIIIDRSGSMSGSKIVEARRAAAAAVDVIRDGVDFAVVAGTHTAKPVYPDDGSLAIATTSTKAAAQQAIGRVKAGGGTAIGSWLRLAHHIFGTRPAVLRHAILLTDGINGERPKQLDAAISLCEGVFSCDCRGVGTGWRVPELRKISTALLGTVGIVAEPDGLAADFEAIMQAAMGKEVADVMLRVRVPQTARVRFVKQTEPTAEDLTGRRAEAGPQTSDYPTGAWGGQESRDYHVGVEVQPAGIGQEMQAARISLVLSAPSGSEVLGQGMIKAIWTDNEELSTRIDPRVAKATGQTELADAIQDGLAARRAGDLETATARLGRAVALAHAAGEEETARLLAGVVDVVDPVTGTVQLKAKVRDVDEMTLDVESTKTVRVKR